MTLLERLTNHDWYYEYSDDHTVWRRGREKSQEIERDLKGMGCPYSISDVRMTVQSMILEDFSQEGNTGYWYRKTNRSPYITGTLKTSLIERARAQKIRQWFAENENAKAV